MKRTEIITVVVLWGLCVLAPITTTAADSNAPTEGTVDLQGMMNVIESQQRRLDAQDAQIAEQQKLMQMLVRELQELKGQLGHPASTPEIAGEVPKPAPAQSEIKSFQAAGAADKEEWPGFYRVPGTNTRYQISGFAELDMIHDSGPIATPSAFVTSAIITRNEDEAKGSDGQTNFSIQATRLAVETRTPLSDDRKVTTFVAADLFNDFGSTTPEFRLRQAYAEVSNFLHWGGDLLLGQDWSTYTFGYAIPNTLEFQAPNAIFGTRHPMVRWTMPFEDGLKLKLALEAPDLRNFEGASSESRWPDSVFALSYEKAPYFLMGGLLGRDMRASNGDGNIASEFGWGATLQGRFMMPEFLKDDFAQFSVTYGEGIGGLLNDVPLDGVYNPVSNELELIDTLAWFAAYQHQWSPKYYSLATYGYVEQDNLGIQAPTAYNKTQYSSVDLVWTPDPRWLLGIELVYGTREDKDGESGSVFRTLVTSRFNF